MLDEDPDLHFAKFEPNVSPNFIVCRREKTLSKMLRTGWKKTIQTLVTRFFLQRKLQNRFWLVTNQGSVSVVTPRMRWW